MWIFIESKAANCESCTLNQVTPTFLTPQMPTEEECIKNLRDIAGSSLYKTKMLKIKKKNSKNIRTYENPIN